MSFKLESADSKLRRNESIYVKLEQQSLNEWRQDPKIAEGMSEYTDPQTDIQILGVVCCYDVLSYRKRWNYV